MPRKPTPCSCQSCRTRASWTPAQRAAFDQADADAESRELSLDLAFRDLSAGSFEAARVAA